MVAGTNFIAGIPYRYRNSFGNFFGFSPCRAKFDIQGRKSCFIQSFMKSPVYIHALVICFLALPLSSIGQCGAGTTAAELNWDHLDFLPSNNTNYSNFYPSAAFPYTQQFSMGTRKVSFAMSPAANVTLNGENTTNTAHGGSPNVTDGADVQFTTTNSGNTSITFTFDAEVSNLRFSLFDLDNSQRATVSATNAASVAQNVTITLANGTSGITIGGTATSRTATAPATGYASNDTRGSVNITIAGPLRQVVIMLNNATGNIWLSDIDACVTGSFPLNYRVVSRPFTGQPQYVLTVVNNNIYYTNPENGQCFFLFNEPAHNRLNSLAYDPYRRRVFYTFSLTGGSNPVNDKAVRMYDVDSKTISVIIPNVNDYGIPSYESGVESGAASFYNGSLYLGIEGYTSSDYAASRKSTIWRIDFDASGNPVAPASQVWGILADDGVNSQNIHDWSDFGIVDGRVIDFDGSGSGDYDYFHFDMMTGVQSEYTPVGPVPRQVAIGWNENVYNVNSGITLYNGTNGQGTEYTHVAPLGPTIPTGGSASWGDAAEAYRPFLDFGDAPASYDPDPLAPACHDTLTPTVSGTRRKLQLGANEDVEWLKRGTTTTEDNYEDGLSFVPIYSPETGAYNCRVTVLNNTNTLATIIGWLDVNGNGLFDTGEACTPINVASSASTQELDLVWSSLPNILLNGTYTYLRIRIAAAAEGMGTDDATGYFSTGEVEDYRIVVDNTPLPIMLSSFEARTLRNNSVLLTWVGEEEPNFPGYDVERSADGRGWEKLADQSGSGYAGRYNYQYEDTKPLTGKSWYRIKLRLPGSGEKYSTVKWVFLHKDAENPLLLLPNPVRDQLNIHFQSPSTTTDSRWQLLSLSGQSLMQFRQSLIQGSNSFSFPLPAQLPSGIYLLRVQLNEQVWIRQFLVQHQ